MASLRGGGVKECGRNPSRLLAILLLGLCVILWVPEEVPAPMDTLWKEATPGALQWENPEEAEYAWTGRGCPAVLPAA